MILAVSQYVCHQRTECLQPRRPFLQMVAGLAGSGILGRGFCRLGGGLIPAG